MLYLGHTILLTPKLDKTSNHQETHLEYANSFSDVHIFGVDSERAFVLLSGSLEKPALDLSLFAFGVDEGE